MEKYLGYDCETGGLNSLEHSLLTCYMGIFTMEENGQFKLHDEIDLRIKPNPGESYCVTEEAMRINKIDLNLHDKIAITRSEAAKGVYYFVKLHSANGVHKLIPTGHNEPFDKGFIINHLLIPTVWGQFVDYHNMDSAVIARAAKAKKQLPPTQKLKLSLLAKALNVDFLETDLHTAKGDVHLTMKTLAKLLKL